MVCFSFVYQDGGKATSSVGDPNDKIQSSGNWPRLNTNFRRDAAPSELHLFAKSISGNVKMSLMVSALVLVALLVALVATGFAIARPQFRIIASVVAAIGFGLAASAVAFFVFVVSRMG